MPNHTIDWLIAARNVRVPPIDGMPSVVDQMRLDGYTFTYYSSYRPLGFVAGMDCRIPGYNFLLVKQPLPLARVASWQLTPAGDAEWEATLKQINPRDLLDYHDDDLDQLLIPGELLRDRYYMSEDRELDVLRQLLRQEAPVGG